MADWSPLAEDDPLPGDPLGVAQLICHLREEALAIADTTVQLTGLDSGLWKGDAATAFRQRQESLQPDLDLVGRRIYGTIQSLDAFGRAVQDAQSQGRRALADALDAEDKIKRAQLGLETMSRQEIAPGEPATSGPLARPAPGPVWGPNWQGQLDEAEAQIASARRLFADACEVYRTAEHRCEKQLEEVAHDDLTDRKKRGFLGSIGHAVTNIADHFTDLEKFSDLLGATAAVVGVASMVPGLQFLAPVGLVTSGLKTLVDINLAATGRQGWGEVGKDALGLALFGASRVATVAARGSVASKAAGELKTAKFAARMGKIGDMVKKVEDGGPLLTGRSAYRFITERSPKLLKVFGDDQFAGRLPSWRRSLYAMRHLDLGLPEAESLRIAPRAVKWAFAAQSIDVGGAVMGSHGLGNLMENREEGRPR